MFKLINKTGYYVRVNESHRVAVGGTIHIEAEPVTFEKWWGKAWTLDRAFEYTAETGELTLPPASPSLHASIPPPLTAAAPSSSRVQTIIESMVNMFARKSPA